MVDTSSGRRAKPFNLLWDEWEATKQPVQERANILPFGTYADGSTHLAFPGLLAMPFEGFARGQALSGHDIAANPEIGIPAAVDVAGGAMTGGFAATAAGATPKNAVGIFGGRLAKTADQNALARAEKLAAEGAPREQIWNDTGWFQGADGQWLHDVPGAAQVNLAVRNGRLKKSEATLGSGDIISHAGVTEAYPHLANMPVKTSGEQWSHYWPGKNNSVTIGEASYRPQWQSGVADGNEVFGSPSGYYTLRKTAEHELDHAAYEAEGGSFYRGLGTAVNSSWPEVRARAAEKRMDLTADERRARPPWLDYDVPESDQITRFYSNSNPSTSLALELAKDAAGAGERGALMANGLSRSSPAAARELDDLGFYSKALESAKAIPQQSGTPEQMISMLRKAGTKEGEIEATGLRQAFAGRQSVSRQEVEDYLRANRVRVKRTDDPKSFKSYTFLGNDDYNAAILSLDGSNNVRGHSGHFNVPNTVGHVMSTMTRTSDGQQVYLADQVQSDWGQTLRKFNGNPSAIEAKRAGLQSQYDELSAKANAADPEIVKLHGELADAYDKMQPGWFRSQSSRDSAALRHSIISQQIREIESQYSDDMSRVGQELANLSQKPDPHPLVNTTDQWLNTTLRHAVKDATDKGADYFALPTGDTVLSYNPGEEIGMNAFYNDIVKKNLTNIMSDLAGEKITPTTEKNLGGKFGGEFNMFPLNEAVKESVRSGLPLFSNSNPSTSLALELAKDAANVPAQKWITAYHGGAPSIEKFDSSYIGSGNGQKTFAQGMHFSTNKSDAEYFKPDNGKIYEVRLPSEGWLNMDAPLSESGFESVLRGAGFSDDPLRLDMSKAATVADAWGAARRNLDDPTVFDQEIRRKLIDAGANGVVQNKDHYVTFNDDIIDMVSDQKGFTAYHGSPHDFDKFDMSKIGTGEGAQAYGHGLYFAENEGVAKSYQEGLSGGSFALDQLSVRDSSLPWLSQYMSRESNLLDVRKRIESGINSRIERYNSLSNYRDKTGAAKVLLKEIAEEIDTEKKRLSELSEYIEKHGAEGAGWKTHGKLYQVRINADPNDFLDWDKPLSQQSEKVRAGTRQALLERGLPKQIADYLASSDRSARDAMSALARGVYDTRLNVPDGKMAAQASSKLREAGIPGIKYLDQDSRTAGDGSRNYVLFRDDIIDIVKKYGVAYAAMMYGEDAVNSAMGTGAAASPGQTDY